jgi:hypothetical protein
MTLQSRRADQDMAVEQVEVVERFDVVGIQPHGKRAARRRRVVHEIAGRIVVRELRKVVSRGEVVVQGHVRSPNRDRDGPADDERSDEPACAVVAVEQIAYHIGRSRRSGRLRRAGRRRRWLRGRRIADVAAYGIERALLRMKRWSGDQQQPCRRRDKYSARKSCENRRTRTHGGTSIRLRPPMRMKTRAGS